MLDSNCRIWTLMELNSEVKVPTLLINDVTLPASVCVVDVMLDTADSTLSMRADSRLMLEFTLVSELFKLVMLEVTPLTRENRVEIDAVFALMWSLRF